jgi:hypothetical protein
MAKKHFAKLMVRDPASRSYRYPVLDTLWLGHHDGRPYWLAETHQGWWVATIWPAFTYMVAIGHAPIIKPIWRN